MAITPEMQAIIDAAEAGGVDHTETGPEFEYTIPDEGYRGARLIEYIELGLQPQTYGGKPKPPCMEVAIAFELFGNNERTKDIIAHTDEDGKVTHKTGTRYQLMPMTVKIQEKAGFKKLFLKMANGRQDVKSVFRMMGEAFRLGIVHVVREASEGKKEATFANMKNKDGAWLIGPALVQKRDDMGNPDGPPTVMKVPEPRLPMKLFIMERPTQESWDSLFIDGTYEKDGKDVSKNRIQQKILGSINFKGSALETMLMKLDKLPMGEAADSGADDLGDLEGMEGMGGEANHSEKSQPGAEQRTTPATTAESNGSTQETSTETASPSKTEEEAPKKDADDPFGELNNLDM